MTRIALVQHRVGEDHAANLRRGLEAIEEAAAQGAQLVLFPELSFEPFHPRRPAPASPSALAVEIPGEETEVLSAAARRLGVVVVNLYERVGRLGVAICYDRHYPEVLRALALGGAELVCVPQAGARGEWPEGIFEAEMRVAAFQNGVFCALANRVGREDPLEFAGGSFVCDPEGRVLARAPEGEEALLFADLDLSLVARSPARRLFLRDRRPDLYPAFVAPERA